MEGGDERFGSGQRVAAVDDVEVFPDSWDEAEVEGDGSGAYAEPDVAWPEATDMATSRCDSASGPVAEADPMPASVSSPSSSTRVPAPKCRPHLGHRPAQRQPAQHVRSRMSDGLKQNADAPHRTVADGVLAPWHRSPRPTPWRRSLLAPGCQSHRTGPAWSTTAARGFADH